MDAEVRLQNSEIFRPWLQAGAYLVNVYLNTSGTSQLVGTLSEADLLQQPFPTAVEVVPGPASAQSTTVSLLHATGTAGGNVTVLLTPFDAFGNQLQCQQHQAVRDAVTATAEALDKPLIVPMTVVFQPDSCTFRLTARLILPGEYSLQVDQPQLS